MFNFKKHFIIEIPLKITNKQIIKYKINDFNAFLTNDKRNVGFCISNKPHTVNDTILSYIMNKLKLKI